MKKILGIVLSIVAVLTLLIVMQVNAATVMTEGYYSYTVTNDEATIVDCDTSISGDVVIPSTLGGYPVTKIADGAFTSCRGITGITIPASITSITIDTYSNGVFYGCSNLSAIKVDENNTVYHSDGNCIIKTETKTLVAGCKTSTIPTDGSVTTIGAYAFYNIGLNTFSIPDSVTSIEKFAFDGCSSLRGVTISENVTKIGQWAFRGCYNLLETENGVTYIDKWAIDCDTSMTSVSLRSDTIGIADDLFYYSDVSVTSITIPSSVRFVGAGAFGAAQNLANVYISDIAAWCSIEFADARSHPLYYDGKLYLNGSPVTSITIPEGVTKIGNYAFNYCKSLTSVTIPASVMSIGNDAFSWCSNLTSITFSAGSELESIGYGAFMDCNRLQSIIIPGSVKRISQSAFEGCSSLRSMTVPFVGTSLDGIGATYFGSIFGARDYNDNSEYVPTTLKNVVVTGGTNIARGAFYDCSYIEKLTLPNSLTNVGLWAFDDCTALKSVYFSDVASWCQIQFESTPMGYAENLYFDGVLATNIEIPNGITYIGDNVFAGCSTLKSVIIPDSVTSIGNGAFYDCVNIKSITLSDNVTSVGQNAFNGCINLKNITLSKNLTSIQYATFANCSSLTDVTIPDSVTRIGEESFRNCGKIKNIIVPNNVTSIGTGAFENCNSLESLTIPFVGSDKDGTLGSHFRYIFGLSMYIYTPSKEYVPASLKSVIITGGTSIAQNAFMNCGNITSITIPNSVTTIGYGAFEGCNSLTAVYIDSADIAALLTSNSSAGYLTGYALSIAVKSDITNIGRYVTSKGYRETIPYNGVMYDVYGTCNHDWVEYSIGGKMCGSTVEKGKVCNKCNLKTNVFYASHKYSEPTCIWNGSSSAYFLFVCSECNHTEYVEATITGETIKDPTCSQTGIKVYTAKITFLLVEYTDQIEVVIPVNDEHMEGTWIIDAAATCISTGSKHKECTICHAILEIATVLKAEHTAVITPAVAATCSSTGLTEGKHCSVCRLILIQQTVTEKLEHTSQWVVDYAATCKQVGYKHSECTVCNTILEVVIIPTVAHTPTSTPAVEANCSSIGLTEGTHCSTCGVVIEPQMIVDKLPHTPGEWIVDKNPCCVCTGIKHRVCTECFAIVEIAEIAALGHTEAKDSAIAANCSSTGLTEGTHCSTCGVIIVPQTVVEKLPHTPGEWIVDKNPCCVCTGIKTRVCTECSAIVETAEIAALGHTEIKDSAVAATCISTGLTEGKHCIQCEEVIVPQRLIPATGHTYESVVTDPTCTKQGFTTHTCHCGDGYVDSYVNANGHALGEWYETLAPTCTDEGIKQRDCKNCDHFETEELTEVGHTYESVVTAPTCNEQGYTTHTCHCGDSYVDNYLDAKGHSDPDGDYRCNSCKELTIDVNGDGILNISDVNDLLICLAGMENETDYQVDIDRNGILNVNDLNTLLVVLSTKS